jgi:hypothetical protein
MIPRLRARRWIISFTIGHTSRQDQRGGNTERKQRRGNANERGGRERDEGVPCPGCTRDTGETQKYKSTGRRGLTGSARAGPAPEKLLLAGVAGRPIVSEIASGAAAASNGNGGTAYRGFPFAGLSRLLGSADADHLQRRRFVVRKKFVRGNDRSFITDLLLPSLRRHDAKRRRGIPSPRRYIVTRAPDPIARRRDFVNDLKTRMNQLRAGPCRKDR